METLPLGKTGIEVSALCLGTAYYGTYIDREASFVLLDQYFEAGGRFVDTANCYAGWAKGASGGESEKTIGEWLRERGNRYEMFIATKVGIGYSGVKSGLTARQIEAECEKSLKRLGVETIDLYYAHRDDRRTRLEKTLETFDRLVTAGKVRFIGASNYRPWRLEETRWISETKGWAGFCCTQNHYTYLQPRPGADFDYTFPADGVMFDYCRARNLTILAYHVMLWGAYAGGELWDKYAGEHSQVRLAALRSVAEQTGATANQIVLAWMLQSDPPVLPLTSPSKPDHLRENLGALDVDLSVEQIKYLNQA